MNYNKKTVLDVDVHGKKVLLAYGGGSVKKNGIYDEIKGYKRNGIFWIGDRYLS